MDRDRPKGLRALVIAGRLAILAGLIVGMTGLARVVADGLETGLWDPALALGWAVLGALPYVGGSLTGRALRGPGNEGLTAVCLVTTLLGVLAVALWIVDGMSRR